MLQDGESWHKLTCELHQLITVTSLHIGLCPVSVVHAVADQMLWLQHFSLENIFDPDRFSFLIAGSFVGLRVREIRQPHV